MVIQSVLGKRNCLSYLHVEKAAFVLFEIAQVLLLMHLPKSENLSCGRRYIAEMIFILKQKNSSLDNGTSR